MDAEKHEFTYRREDLEIHLQTLSLSQSTPKESTFKTNRMSQWDFGACLRLSTPPLIAI